MSETSHTRVSTVRTRSQIPRRHTHGRASTRHVSHPVHRECDEKSLHELSFHIHRLHRFTASLACTSRRETRVAWLASQPVLSMPSADVRCLPPTTRGAISSGDLFYITSAVLAAKGVRQLADAAGGTLVVLQWFPAGSFVGGVEGADYALVVVRSVAGEYVPRAVTDHELRRVKALSEAQLAKAAASGSSLVA